VKVLRRILPAVMALAMFPTTAAAQAVIPPPSIVKLSEIVIRVANSGDGSALSGAFTPNAVVVDENAPFEWRGSSAGTAWWTLLATRMRRAKLTHLHAGNVRVGEYRQSPTAAYLVEAMTIAGQRAGVPFAKSGTMTYTFSKMDGRWLISTMVWSTKP
jgi:Domain of unknown function (DUF4440)